MPIKVLIVDDMRNFLDLEASFLKRSECTILTASNGLEALRIAKNDKPDIIFLDLEMPVMNGIECCRFIRSDIKLKNVPIIVVTASSKREECYSAGCSSYLQKPIDEEVFLSEVKKFVSIKERQDPRVNVSMPVTVDFKGTKTPGIARNISRFGLLVSTPEPFAVGSKIAVGFSLPGNKGRVKATAMIIREIATRNPEHRGIGLRFREVSEKHQSMIDSFIAEQLKKKTDTEKG